VNLCGLPGFATGFVGGFGFCTAEVGRVVGARGRKLNGGRSSLFVRPGQFMSQSSAKHGSDDLHRGVSLRDRLDYLDTRKGGQLGVDRNRRDTRRSGRIMSVKSLPETHS
jgi:hypothetical protein